MCHLSDPDSRRRSGETWQAGLELTDRAEVSLAEEVDACNSEPVGLPWSQLLLLSAQVVLRPGTLPLEGGLMGKQRIYRSCVVRPWGVPEKLKVVHVPEKMLMLWKQILSNSICVY